MSASISAIPYYRPGSWVIDSSRSLMRFSVRHLGFHHAAGSMTVGGTVVVADQPLDSAVEALIDLASVDTGNRGRDNAIRSEPLLDVASRPTASYRSTRLEVDTVSGRADSFVLQGELALLGVTRHVPLRIDVEFLPGPDEHRIRVVGRGRFDRRDFDLRYHRGPRFLDRTIASLVDVEVRIDGLRKDELT